MYMDYTSSSVRLTGRFAPLGNAIASTATGSTIEIAFSGKELVLHFDMTDCIFPFPSLYIQIDNGVKTEAAMARYLRVEMPVGGEHYAKIIYKGGREAHSRWYAPMAGKIAFLGYDADAPADLPADPRKTIEFVGDSITEGVLIDDRRYYSDDQDNRIFQDDVTATYAYLTAEGLGLRDLHMGYGAVGVTHGGQGGVPKAAEAYPYCFDGAPVMYDHPDFILINHGANDRGAPEELYIAEYRGLLELVRKTHPDAKIISLAAFSNCYPKALEALIESFNAEHGDDVFFVDATLWVPLEPLHPLRDGHRLIADKLIAILKEHYNL